MCFRLQLRIVEIERFLEVHKTTVYLAFKPRFLTNWGIFCVEAHLTNLLFTGKIKKYGNARCHCDSGCFCLERREVEKRGISKAAAHGFRNLMIIE